MNTFQSELIFHFSFLDSQRELDVKFGEFSERVFGMFLQDPDDIKTMKMADHIISYEKKLKQKKKIISA